MAPTTILRQFVLDVAYRLIGDANEADDVLQDVFIALPDALRQYIETGEFEAWLRRSTVRTALVCRRFAQRCWRTGPDGAVRRIPASHSARGPPPSCG